MRETKASRDGRATYWRRGAGTAGGRRLGTTVRKRGGREGGEQAYRRVWCAEDGPGAGAGLTASGERHNDSDSAEGRGATDAPSGRGGT